MVSDALVCPIGSSWGLSDSDYGSDDTVIGGYEAGENRSQIIFAGYYGGYGGDSTLQSTSG